MIVEVFQELAAWAAGLILLVAGCDLALRALIRLYDAGKKRDKRA